MIDQDEVDDLRNQARHDRKRQKNERLADGDPDKEYPPEEDDVCLLLQLRQNHIG